MYSQQTSDKLNIFGLLRLCTFEFADVVRIRERFLLESHLKELISPFQMLLIDLELAFVDIAAKHGGCTGQAQELLMYGYADNERTSSIFIVQLVRNFPDFSPEVFGEYNVFCRNTPSSVEQVNPRFDLRLCFRFNTIENINILACCSKHQVKTRLVLCYRNKLLKRTVTLPIEIRQVSPAAWIGKPNEPCTRSCFALDNLIQGNCARRTCRGQVFDIIHIQTGRFIDNQQAPIVHRYSAPGDNPGITEALYTSDNTCAAGILTVDVPTHTQGLHQSLGHLRLTGTRIANDHCVEPTFNDTGLPRYFGDTAISKYQCAEQIDPTLDCERGHPLTVMCIQKLHHTVAFLCNLPELLEGSFVYYWAQRSEVFRTSDDVVVLLRTRISYTASLEVVFECCVEAEVSVHVDTVAALERRLFKSVDKTCTLLEDDFLAVCIVNGLCLYRLAPKYFSKECVLGCIGRVNKLKHLSRVYVDVLCGVGVIAKG